MVLDWVGDIQGGIAAGAGDTSRTMRFSTLDPDSNFSLQSALFDQGGQFGFADFSLLERTGPFNRLIAEIQAMPIEERQKRRALQALYELKDTGKMPRISPKEGYGKFLQIALRNLGMNESDLMLVIESQRRFDTEFEKLSDIGPFQGDVIRDRLTASAGVANTAAGFATGQGSKLQDLFREQIMRDQGRNIDDQEEALLLQSQFGGFNPGVGLEQLAQSRLDLPLEAELRAIQRAFDVAGGVNNLLNPGSSAALSAGELSIGAAQGAVGIAANQATSSNVLDAAARARAALAMGQGIEAAGEQMSSNIQTFTTMGMSGGTGSKAPASGTASGP